MDMNDLNPKSGLDLFSPNDSTDENQEELDEKSVETDSTDLFDANDESEEEDTDDTDGDDNEETDLDGEDEETSEESSPKSEFYTSITQALVDEGVFPDLGSKDIKKIKTGEDFVKLVDEQVNSKLNEVQQRINSALTNNVDPQDIRYYEGTLHTLNSITDEFIELESDDAETFRHNIIMLDFLNRGFSKERAAKMALKSIDAGNDIEDAKEALESNKEFFNQLYQDLINDAKKQQEAAKKELKKVAESLKKRTLETEEPFKGISISKDLRQKIYKNIAEPSFKDEDGNYLTAIQKYDRDNHENFMYNLGVIFTLTDGFKNIDKLIGSKVNREKKKSIMDLESKFANSFKGGKLTFMSNPNDDAESYDGLTLKV